MIRSMEWKWMGEHFVSMRLSRREVEVVEEGVDMVEGIPGVDMVDVVAVDMVVVVEEEDMMIIVVAEVVVTVVAEEEDMEIVAVEEGMETVEGDTVTIVEVMVAEEEEE